MSRGKTEGRERVGNDRGERYIYIYTWRRGKREERDTRKDKEIKKDREKTLEREEREKRENRDKKQEIERGETERKDR